jgi:4-methyl-5(b-hydroxyethyl)-thiazole monophosphate biosynthesis
MVKKVLLFLSQGFEELESAAFTDVFGWSREAGKDPVELVTTGLREEIKCTWNFIVKPELSFDSIDVSDFDALAIPGGFEDAGFYEDAFDERILDLIRNFNESGKLIASICVGSMPISRSGILKGRKGTTYDLMNGHRRNQMEKMGVNVVDERIVVDGNVITSTGPATSLDVAFMLLEMLTSRENVKEVQYHMRF